MVFKVATENIWRRFFDTRKAAGRFSIYIHCHPSASFRPNSFLYPYQIVEPRVQVLWGSMDMIRAELTLMHYALQDPMNMRFVLVSDTCVPLWTFECTYVGHHPTPSHLTAALLLLPPLYCCYRHPTAAAAAPSHRLTPPPT